ncbi:host specificity protein J [Chromobacterium haemolyticum]|uniref:host specificity protein J n=1 Tax=Chromobacterium haemolyticum TaxID=394935 RepID=UPI0009DA3797|nr:host specificity factor TipJ family phage tail protein [Chromobacterium haemolyticum]
MEMTTPNAVRLAFLPHPLLLEGRQLVQAAFRRNETLGGYCRRTGIEVDEGHAVSVNGRTLAPETWRKYRLKQNDIVLVRALVRGGGGKVFRSIALLALAFTAPYLAGFAMTGTWTAMSGALAIGIMVGGSILINTLLPPPKPQLGAFGCGAEQSPTYSLAGARNRLRPFEPMPLVMGKHRMVPDLAGKPYTVFEGAEQFLFQSFHFGLQSELKLENFKLGETLLSSYQDVTIFEAGPDGVLPAEFGNVDTEQGREIKAADGWVERTTSPDTIAIGIDVQGLAYFARDDGGIESRSIEFQVEYRAFPDGAWRNFGNRTFTLHGRGINIARLSISEAVQRGQYAIRVIKVSADGDSSRYKNQFAVAQIRSHQFDGADYTGQRRVGVRIKASNQLNGTIDELSAVASSEIPVWENGGWALRATLNPAWWLLWWLRGRRAVNGRRLFGGGLPDQRIEIESIKSFAVWCEAKRLSFSRVLDRGMPIKEVAEMIARCGRGQMTWQSGRYGVVWDADELPVVAVFGPANIKAKSFRINYQSGKLADEIIVNFVNQSKDWKPDSVRVVVQGVSDPANPATLDFIGCTDADVAGREARLLAASQALHRRRISWETDIEGMVAGKGDVVLLSHDMASWSFSGRLLGGNRQELRLDRAVPLGATAYVGIRFPDGNYSTYRVKGGGGESALLRLRDPIPVSDADGPLPVPDESPDAVALDWMWFYDPATHPGRKVKIIDAKPLDNGDIQFTACDYLPEYYAAEKGDFAYVPPRPSRPPLIGYLSLTESSRVNARQQRVPTMQASWPPVRGATQYRYCWRREEGIWNEALTSETQHAADVEPGYHEASVAPLFADGGISRPAFAHLTVTAMGEPPAAPQSFYAVGDLLLIELAWRYPPAVDIAGVELFGQIGDGPKARLTSLPFPSDRWTHIGLSVGVTVEYELVLLDGWGNRSAPVKARASTEKNPAKLLEQLQGSIGGGQLTEELQKPLGKLPQIADSANSALQAAYELMLTQDDRDTAHTRNYAIARREIKTLNTDLSSEASERLRLAAAFDDSRADFLEEKKATASAREALASDLKLLRASHDDSVAALKREEQARANADEALARADEVLGAKLGENEAALRREVEARVNGEGATAKSLEALGAKVGENASAIQAEREVRATEVGAVARSVETLEVTVNGNTAAIQETSLVVDGIQAEKVLKVTAGDKIAGMGLRADKDGSRVDFLADKFAVSLPDGSGSRQIFTAGSVNGQPMVGIDGDLILRGTLSGDRLLANSVEADKIDSRQLTIKDPAGNVVVDFNGMGSHKINGQLNAGQIDTRGLTVRDGAGNVILDAGGMHGTYIKDLTIGTLKIANGSVSWYQSWGRDFRYGTFYTPYPTTLVIAGAMWWNGGGESSIRFYIDGNILVYGMHGVSDLLPLGLTNQK